MNHFTFDGYSYGNAFETKPVKIDWAAIFVHLFRVDYKLPIWKGAILVEDVSQRRTIEIEMMPCNTYAEKYDSKS